MRYWYTAIAYLLLPFVWLYLCLKAIKSPAYLKHWHERLGLRLGAVPPRSLWIHAASVGEINAVVPLIKTLKQQYPTLPILITHHTPTGATCIQTRLGGKVSRLYAPYDLPGVLRRFLNTVQPRALILVETELWPNYLAQCHQRKVPTILVNARLSANSAKAYRRFAASLTRQMLKNLTLVLAQTQADAQRLIDLGLAKDCVHVTSSIKFDLELPADLHSKAKQLRSQWGAERLVWIAASTHAGEEKLLLKAYAIVHQAIPTLLLILVPRHPERCAAVTHYCRQQTYKVIQHSTAQTGHADIFIGDTLGKLLLLYAAADLAFIGGSLVKKGGQNPIEPAALGLVCLTGPYTFNFDSIMGQLHQVGAVISITNYHQLAAQVICLLQDSQQRCRMGTAAKAFVQQNRGAMQRQLDLLQHVLFPSL